MLRNDDKNDLYRSLKDYVDLYSFFLIQRILSHKLGSNRHLVTSNTIFILTTVFANFFKRKSK